ncbi:MAG: hypothetical protein M5R40_07365 [Anaerolineae bacterium]|nr:hypothetical protein [Anaerolineae bacterium]
MGARLLTGDADRDEPVVLEEAKKVIAEYNLSAASQGLPLLALDPDEAAQKIVDRILGWGPLTELMEDPSIEDIAVNGLDSVWVFRAGASGWERQEHVRIPSWDFLHNLVNRKADWRGTGRAITFTNPTVNAQLPDGSRLHGVMAPCPGSGRGPGHHHPPLPTCGRQPRRPGRTGEHGPGGRRLPQGRRAVGAEYGRDRRHRLRQNPLVNALLAEVRADEAW